MGNTRYKSGNYQGAIELYSQAIALAPNEVPPPGALSAGLPRPARPPACAPLSSLCEPRSVWSVVQWLVGSGVGDLLHESCFGSHDGESGRHQPMLGGPGF